MKNLFPTFGFASVEGNQAKSLFLLKSHHDVTAWSHLSDLRPGRFTSGKKALLPYVQEDVWSQIAFLYRESNPVSSATEPVT
jgi:hypothetical protein